LSQVVGPHFAALCREWATQAGEEVFAGFPAEVAGTVIPDPGNRTQIQVDVAVLSAGTPEEPRRVLSLGEAKWGEVMGLGHLGRLRRARDLLSVKKHRAADAILACYGGAGFTPELTATAAADPHVLLVELNGYTKNQISSRKINPFQRKGYHDKPASADRDHRSSSGGERPPPRLPGLAAGV
jgi:hypothetical protein